jgi:predicted porin
MAYGGNLWNWGSVRIGWDLGFGLLPINISDHSSMPASINQSIYTYNTGGILVPDAPYDGGFNRQGEPTIPSDLVSTTPLPPQGGTVTGSYTLDVMLYTVRLGPSVYWDLNEYFGLSAGAGPAIGIVSGSLKYNEKITEHLASGDITVPNTGQINRTDVVYGGYVNASLMYHMVKNGDLYVGVQYMSLGNANISGGGREGRLNLGGQVYISAGINWPF